MNKLIKAIEGVTTPLETACRLGFNPKIKNEHYVIDCPRCTHPMFILDSGFVCTQTECTFKAGGSIDFMAVVQHKRISEVWPDFKEIFDDVLGKMANIDNELFVREALSHFTSRRHIFEIFLRSTLDGFSEQIRVIRQRGSLKRMGVDTGALSSSLYIFTESRFSALSKAIAAFSKSTPPSAGKAPIVLPYFANHHTVSDVIILSSTKRPPHVVHIEPVSKLSWFGLLQAHPTIQEVEIAESYGDCLKYNSEHSITSPDKICLHYIYHRGQRDHSWLPKHARYILEDNDCSKIPNICRLEQNLKSLSIYDNNLDVPARKFILDKCINLLVNEGFNTKARLAIESAMLKPSEREEIFNTLRDQRKYDVIDALNSYFKTLLVYSDDKYSLYESPNGYYVVKGDEGHPVYITNFTLDVEYNLVFPDSPDIFHVATVTVESTQFRVFFQTSDIDRLQDLETALRCSEEREAAGGKLPTVRDRNLGRILSSYLRSNIAGADTVEGTPFLGFNVKRSRFYGPFFYADYNVKTHVKRNSIYHPLAKQLKFFRQIRVDGNPDAVKYNTSIHTDISNHIAQWVAMLVRCFLGLRVRAVSIEYGSVDSIIKLYKGVTGQVEPIIMNTNFRGDFDKHTLGTFPIYVVVGDVNQCRRLDAPYFALCEGGTPFVDIANSEDAILEAQKTFRHIIFRVVDYCFNVLASNKGAFTPVRKIDHANAYASEGAQIICDACGCDDWLTRKNEFETLEKFLASVTYEEVSEVMHHDLNKHMVTIDFSSRSDMNINTIGEELKKLGAKHIIRKDNKITADSLCLLSAVETFYNKEVNMQTSFDPSALLPNS